MREFQDVELDRYNWICYDRKDGTFNQPIGEKWQPTNSSIGAMTYKKNDGGQRFANIHLLVGYTSETVASYQKLAEELRKTFPQATDMEVRCGKVRKSSYCESFSIVAFDAHIPEGNYPEWQQNETGRLDYFW